MAFAFAQFGEVARVHLARDADTKKLRGCASFTHTHTHTQKAPRVRFIYTHARTHTHTQSSAGAPHLCYAFRY